MRQRLGRTHSRACVLIVAAVVALIVAAAIPAWCQDAPKPDPAGVATGDKTNAVDASGTSFVPPAPPSDPSDPTYAEKKKAYDEFTAQAAKEPLAVKLADSVGHVRIGTNFGWTLNTGFLVLFMQAGFALLTTGLVRKKNAAHLMMLNFAAYVIAFLGYYALGFAFQFGGRGECRAGQPGRHADAERARRGRHALGLARHQGLLPQRSGI